MSAHEDQSLTAEELRKRLYQRFKKKGLLDAVKTQLRTQLIMELQHESVPRTSSEQTPSLSLLASNSLVIHHLQSCGYEYTLSVFYPECGVSKEKVFTTKDILQLLRIGPQSPVYEHLVTTNPSGQKGLLINLLSECIDRQLQWRVCDADTQTSDSADHTVSIVRKMQVIDDEYELLRQRGQRWASVEVKLAEYRKQMEEQAEAELKSKIQHFQEVEMERVRMEEREKRQQETTEIRRQLERNYDMKAEALMIREKNAIERLQRQQQIAEQEMYGQRQALLKEIESVHQREAELTLRMESFQNSCKLHAEKMRSSDELLRKRELDVRKMEEMYELKLSNEIRKHQLELKEDYARRTEALTENENRNKDETARLQREAAIIDSRTAEYQRVASELARVQKELALVRGNVCVLKQENAELKDKLEGARDYASIRNERTELQAEVFLLMKQLEESQKEKQRLQQELAAPSAELLTLQAELKRQEAARRLEQEEFQNRMQAFHSQLSQEVERCGQLKAQLLECEERTKWMTTHTEELKQQLRHTQQALETEVLRNPKLSLVDSSVLRLSPASTSLTDVDGYHERLCDPGSATRGRRRLRTEGEEEVAAALNRIEALEKEAESLEEAYRSYKRRGVASQIPFQSTSSAPACAPATFVMPKTRVVTEHVYTPTETNQQLPGHMTPPTASSPSIRRLSSTPVSASKTKPRAHTEQVLISGLGSQREVSPIPVVSLEEYTHITLPSSPQMKSTARDNYSPPKRQLSSSSSQESSPQPERINIQDLTKPQTDFPDGSEQQAEEAHTHSEQHVPSSPEQKQEEKDKTWRMKDEDEERMKEDMEERWMKENEEERKRMKEEKRRMNEDEEKRRRIKEEEKRRMNEDEEENRRVNEDKVEKRIKEDEEEKRRMKEEEEEKRRVNEDEEEKRRMKEDEEEKRRMEEEKRKMKEDEDRSWQEETQLKEEKRWIEKEEVQEAERRELERLQQQEELPQVEKEKEEETGSSEIQDRGTDAQMMDDETEETRDNPLHKYMLMVMQGREREREQKKEESQSQSSEPVMLSDHKDDSVATFSHEDADDDFW